MKTEIPKDILEHPADYEQFTVPTFEIRDGKWRVVKHGLRIIRPKNGNGNSQGT